MYYPVGKIDWYFGGSTSGGTKTIYLRPPNDDEEWLILQAWAYHDDGTGSRATNWNYFDSRIAVKAIAFPAFTIAAAVALSIYHLADPTTYNASPPPIGFKATRLVYPGVTCASMAAGKYVYIRAIYISRWVEPLSPDNEQKRIYYPQKTVM